MLRALAVAILAVLGVVSGASAQPHTRWYLPEGATGPVFEEHILLANPTSTAATVRLTFLRPGGSSQTHDTTVAPFSRATIVVNNLPGLASEGELSAIVESTNGVPIMAERTMYWIGTDRRGGHNATGIGSPSTTWYLAEGSTGFFSTYLLLANPGTTPATTTVSFQREDGVSVDRVYTVGATSRLTIFVNDVPGMTNQSFATTISASAPIFVERAMYWLDFAGGHDASAIAAPSRTWHFAEGYTGEDFHTFVLLGNPNTTTASVTVRFMTDTGTVVLRSYTIAPRARLTIYTNQLPEITPAAFATSVDSNVPIVAERASYWGGFQEGSAVTGEPALQPRWAFADGAAGTVDGFPYETFFLFSNPSASPISVTGTFYREDGTGTVWPITVPAQSRVTLYGATVTGMTDQRFAAFFESASPFLVERAVYWGAGRFGGHGSAGVPWTGAIQAPPGLLGPVISPSGGTFGVEPTIQLTSSTAGIIRYTIDGSAPTSGSTPYGGPFALAQSTTLRARTFFANGSSSQISNATFTLQVAAPSISPPSGTYTGGEPVTIQVPAGSTVRYTTNGLEPNEGSPSYGGPLAFSGQQVQLRARAFRSGWTPSDTVAANYTFTQGTLAMPVPTPAPGIVAPGQNITLSVPSGSLVFYTLDGSEPTQASATYHGIPITLQAPATLRARAFADFFTPSPILTAVYQMRVATPTLSPNGGLFTSSTVVHMSTTTANAVVRYTFDGEDPTESSPSGQDIIVPINTILKVKAFRSGWVTSNLAAATFEHPSPAMNSPAVVQLTGGLSTTGLQQAGGAVQFSIGNGSLDTATVRVNVNGAIRPAGTVSASGGLVTASGALIDGRNQVSLIGQDANGLLIYEDTTLWAGSRSLQVQVRGPSGAIAGATVSAQLAADPDVTASAVTNGSGIAVLSRLPTARVVQLLVQATGYFDKAATVAAGATSVTFTLDLDNNDFEATDARGWVVQSTLQFVLPHSEAPRPWVDCPSCVPRPPAQSQSQSVQVNNSALVNALVGPDYDLVVDTRNVMAPQTVTRSFSVSRGTRAVTLRFRYGSAEVFAPQAAPDVFQVRLRSSSGQSATDTQTAISLRPILSNGVSPWRTLRIPIGPNETVTVDASVVNSLDPSFESYIEIDKIQETRYGAEIKLVEYRNQPSVNTTTNDPLEYLSLSTHTYWNGMTRVRGKMALTMTGPSDDTDAVADVELRVYHGDDLEQRATGRLPQSLRPSVIRGFGPTGRIDLSTVQLLFEIPSADMPDIPQTGDAELTLRLRVTFASGRAPLDETIQYAQKLVRYTGGNRYGDRDADDCYLEDGEPWKPYPCGGDDWALPSTADTAGLPALSGLNFGDFSNMNGGRFPIHNGHRKGIGVDAQFSDQTLMRRDRAMADALINLLNSAVGPRISVIGVTFTTALRLQLQAAPNLVDGSRPLDHIQNWEGHLHHIHIDFNGNAPLRP